MRATRVLVPLVAASCLLAVSSDVCLAQERTGWIPISKEKEDMAVAMLKARTPGEPHALMASLAGEWTFTSRLWVTPGADPEISSGTASAVMLLGGRFLQVTLRGRLSGLPYESVGIRAFDNTTGRYQVVWMDNLSTTLLLLTGTYDTMTRSFTMRGEVSDLVNPAVLVPVREVLTLVDANTCRMEMFETRDGKDTKVLEILYTRTP